MFMGFVKPFLEEAELLNENDASDPVATFIGLGDTYAQIEIVGGLGEGIDFSSIEVPAPEMAPAPAAPAINMDNLMTPEMGMKTGP